ncbi:MAG: TIGR04283 family arsenosugar biosynthesis glycosyltransferase [Isosphaeraceae bacterium]
MSRILSFGDQPTMPIDPDRDTPERLAVFARYPAPGRAKTRLIPALGPEGAASLHAEMARHTLGRVDQLQRIRPVSVEVWYAGGDAARLRSAFGERRYRHQREGDLGTRMAFAFDAMLTEARSAAIIGTDCPALTATILSEAFDSLGDHDLVLGPATDGGYYLIGLRRPAPELFEGMPWGTSSVLFETLARAERLGLTVHQLAALDDVDEPDDLPAWDAVRSGSGGSTDGERPDASIVIPTLNESAMIEAALRSAQGPRVEVIVADGGSTDDTRAIASALGASVIDAPRGRGPQLNAGADVARAPILVFLHADTVLPAGYLGAVRRAMDEPRVALGAFRLSIDRPGAFLRLVEAGVGLRSARLGLPYGDQAMFLRTETFRRLGGFAAVPLMEDVDLVDRARAIGSIRILPEAVITSGRRWEAAGALRMTAINLACLAGHRLGIPSARLAAWRDGLSRRRNRRSAPPDVLGRGHARPAND